MGDTHVGLQARLMSQALRKLAGTLNRTDTICLFTNQLREKIGVMFGNPETTPGGRALKFYSSVRLDIRRIETLKDGVEAIGNRVRVKVVKNKVAPPFKQAEFDIIYGVGIPWEGTVLDAGIERKVVQKSGSYFSFGDERLGQGRHNATAFLREHPDVTQEILRRSRRSSGPTRSSPHGCCRQRRPRTPRRRAKRLPRSRAEPRAEDVALRALRAADRSGPSSSTARAARASRTRSASERSTTSSASAISTTRERRQRAPSASPSAGYGDAYIRADLERRGLPAEDALARLEPESARASRFGDRGPRVARDDAALHRSE